MATHEDLTKTYAPYLITKKAQTAVMDPAQIDDLLQLGMHPEGEGASTLQRIRAVDQLIATEKELRNLYCQIKPAMENLRDIEGRYKVVADEYMGCLDAFSRIIMDAYADPQAAAEKFDDLSRLRETDRFGVIREIMDSPDLLGRLKGERRTFLGWDSKEIEDSVALIRSFEPQLVVLKKSERSTVSLRNAYNGKLFEYKEQFQRGDWVEIGLLCEDYLPKLESEALASRREKLVQECCEHWVTYTQEQPFLAYSRAVTRMLEVEETDPQARDFWADEVIRISQQAVKAFGAQLDDPQALAKKMLQTKGASEDQLPGYTETVAIQCARLKDVAVHGIAGRKPPQLQNPPKDKAPDAPAKKPARKLRQPGKKPTAGAKPPAPR